MSDREALLKEMWTHRTNLLSFAVKLSGNIDRAHDLVQDTFAMAIKAIDSFVPDSNMSAWLFTILRNKFRTDYKKRRREVEDVEGKYQNTLKSQPDQIDRILWKDFAAALEKLPQDHIDAIHLIGIHGFGYEETALICGVPVGTIKSRVHRARQRLLELLPAEDSLFLAAMGEDARVRAHVDI